MQVISVQKVQMFQRSFWVILYLYHKTVSVASGNVNVDIPNTKWILRI